MLLQLEDGGDWFDTRTISRIRVRRAKDETESNRTVVHFHDVGGDSSTMTWDHETLEAAVAHRDELAETINEACKTDGLS